MNKKSIVLFFATVLFWVGNTLAQPELTVSWIDHGTAILDSISGAKYVLAGVDVDQDGKQEILVPIDYGVLNGIPTRQIALFEAVGNDDYELAWSYTFPGEAAGELTQPAVGDLDGDGNLEILAIHVQPEGVNPTLPNFYVFECKGDNDYGTGPTVAWDMNDTRRNNIRCVVAYDLDNDGKMEVVLTDNEAPVIASVSNFDVPQWTIEYIDSESYEKPDMAGITLCNLDGDAYMEVALTPLQQKPQLDIYLIEYDGSAYQMIKPAPKHFYGKGVIHALDAADLDGDGRDELYIGAVETSLLYVVTKPTGDVTELDTTDIYFIGHVEHPDYEAGTGWMPGGTLGDADGDGKMSFLGSASGTVGCGIHDWEYQGGAVTVAQNWQYSYINVNVGWGNDFFIYGIDFADDMDGDGQPEFIVARGYPNIPRTAPLVYILEEIPTTVPEEANVAISWSDAQTAILDSISGAKYVLAGVDVDQDGKQEILVPIDYGVLNGIPTRQIALFEAVGNDDYELAWSYTFPGEAAGELTQPAVGDLDGDGNLEILAIHVQPEGVNPTLPNFYVFECKGDNDYGTGPTVAWDMNDTRRNNIRCVVAYDLDNDGKMEVVLTDNEAPVIASVSNFDVPQWTIEYIDSESYEKPDMAGITLCNLDGDAYMEVGLTPLQQKPQLDIYLIEYDGSAYQMIKPAPKHFYGKGVIHALDAADLDGDGRDELYIGAVETSLLYVVTKPTGDVTELDTTDIYFIGHVEHPDYEAGTGWMPGGTLGDADGDGKMSFLGSASGTVGCGIHDWEYQGGAVTVAQNWQYSYINVYMSWGNDFFIYGIDFADDMDGDGQPEFIVARGYPNIPRTAPLVYVLEGQPSHELEEAHVGISWSDAQTAILDSISGAKYVLAGVDVDQDGKQEILVPIDYGVLNGIPTRQIALFEAVGNDDYELAWSYTFPGEAAGELTQPAVGDLDGDGILEILAIHVQPEGVDPTLPNFYVFECKGDNDYGTGPTVAWDMNDTRRNNIRCVVAYDLDNDGKMEVVLTDNEAPVIASVSNFDVPQWTIEYIDSESYEKPDMAGITLCNLDGDAYMEVGLTPLQQKPQLDIYLIEYDGSAYQMIKPAPKHFYGKGVIHALDAADLDGDGRDELYIGAVETSLLYVVTKPTGDVTELDTTDIYFIGHVEHPDYEAGTGWMPGGTLGDADGDGKMSFLGSASGTVGCGIHDWEYQGGAVTVAQNWKYSYINLDLGWGNDFFIYGIDFADDMDGDGQPEFIVARGYPNIPRDMPLVYVMEEGFVTTGINPGDPLSAGIPETFCLKQNYPNPFNPTTNISYDLPRNCNVTLDVYNILGQKVRTLVDNRFHQQGSYEISWNALDDNGRIVPSGIYLYTLKAGDSFKSGKMILIR